jgi:hypothetical protein
MSPQCLNHISRSQFHLDLNMLSRAVVGDVARFYSFQGVVPMEKTICSPTAPRNTSLVLTTAVVAVEETTDPEDLAFAALTQKVLGMNTQWTGAMRTYWVTFQDAPPPSAHTLINIDRLSNGGAVVRHNEFIDCNHVHFQSIGGSVVGNLFNHTNGVGLIMWIVPWDEGSVGLRDVLVADNVFHNGRSAGVVGVPDVAVGCGTSNISVHQPPPTV